MPSGAAAILIEHIRARGPITVAAFMELALYHPEAGYYSTAPRRSGASGDFFTSVDLGPLFGHTIAAQIAEVGERLGRDRPLHVVEAGAGDARLANDILDALEREHPSTYRRARLTAVERSACARAAHDRTLARHAGRIASSAALPAGGVHVIVANELLDALPVHVLTGTPDGPREVYVSERQGRLVESAGPISEPAIARSLEQGEIAVPEGARIELGLEAEAWIADAAAALDRGLLLLFDYFQDSRGALPRHPHGTLASYSRHTADTHHYLRDPGKCDLTTHADLSAVRRAAAAAGLVEAGAVDQTYFVQALGLAERVGPGLGAADLKARLAAKALWLPGGLGSTMKAVAFSKGFDAAGLRGFAAGRIT